MLRDQDTSPEDRIKALMDGLVQAAQTPEGRRGCLICNAAVDQSPFDAEVESAVKEATSAVRKAIKFCVKGTAAEKNSFSFGRPISAAT